MKPTPLRRRFVHCVRCGRLVLCGPYCDHFRLLCDAPSVAPHRAEMALFPEARQKGPIDDRGGKTRQLWRRQLARPVSPIPLRTGTKYKHA